MTRFAAHPEQVLTPYTYGALDPALLEWVRTTRRRQDGLVVHCPMKGRCRQCSCRVAGTLLVPGRCGDLDLSIISSGFSTNSSYCMSDLPLLVLTRTVSKRAGMVRPRESLCSGRTWAMSAISNFLKLPLFVNLILWWTGTWVKGM